MEDTSTHKRVRLSENVIPDSQQEPNPMSPPMTPRHSSSELYPKISEIKGGINGVKNPAIQGQGQETRLVMGALPKHESTLEGLNGRQKGSGRCSRRAQGWSSVRASRHRNPILQPARTSQILFNLHTTTPSLLKLAVLALRMPRPSTLPTSATGRRLILCMTALQLPTLTKNKLKKFSSTTTLMSLRSNLK